MEKIITKKQNQETKNFKLKILFCRINQHVETRLNGHLGAYLSVSYFWLLSSGEIAMLK